MKTVKYILSVIFILSGLASILEKPIIGSILLILLGIILLPYISEKIKSKFKKWNSKGVRYGSYMSLFIISGVIINRADLKSDTELKNNTHVSDKSNYLESVSKNIANLNEDNKKRRTKLETELKTTSTYNDLVTNQTVSPEYLPVLTAINNALRSSHTEKNSRVILNSIEDPIINQFSKTNTVDDKTTFVIKAISLGSPNNGGFTNELVNIFNRYVKKYKMYGTSNGRAYLNSEGKREEILYPYNLSSISYLIKPSNKALDAIYEANKQGISNWFKKVKNRTYLYPHMATKQGYLNYVAEVYPNSEYLMKVDYDLSASTIYKQYDANEVLADENYKGKKIAITGIIGDIGKDILNDPYVSLKVSYLKNVNCYFDDKNNKIISKLRKGQKIIIIGTCQGKIIQDVIIKNCTIWNK